MVNAWRSNWATKDAWDRFCMGWEFSGVAMLRAELSGWTGSIG
jgi:hypothetical protein